MTRNRWFLIAIATSLILQSCGQVEVPFSCTLPTDNQSVAQSNALDIKIAVDGSGSMLGYVSNPESRYVQTLELLDDTLSLGGLRPQTSLNYYRSDKLVGRSDFRKAQLPVFYNGTNPKFPNISIPIQDFIIKPSGKKDTLLVLVTELDQAAGDLTILNKKIQETYFNQNNPEYAVGIWAIKSSFQGIVRIQEQQRILKFPFPNKQSSEKLRPFYVIFIGRYNDIIKYFDTLKNEGADLIKGSQLSIFSANNIVKEISYLDKEIEVKSPEGKATPKEWSLDNNLVKVQVQDQNSQLWKIPSNQTEAVKIQDSVNLMSLNNTVGVDVNSIETIKQIRVFDKFSNGKDEYFKDYRKILKNDSSLENAINIDQWGITKNKENNQQKLNFVTTIQPDKFPESGIYLFEIDVVAKNLLEQPWWQDWNWVAGKDKEQDGSKTHNLLNFMRGLKTTTANIMAETHPKIGRFCYVLQKE